MGKNIIIVIVIIVLIVLGFWLFSGDTKNENSSDSTLSPTTSAKEDVKNEFDYKSTLNNVSSDSNLAQVTGEVMAGFSDGVYRLEANFQNLPVPAEGFYYEGRLARNYRESLASNGKPDYISTGKITFGKGGALNIFTSSTDLTDYTFYFLSLEPSTSGAPVFNTIMEGELIKK